MANNIPLSEHVTEYLLNNFGHEYLENYKKYINTDINVYVRISPLWDNQDRIVKNLEKYGIVLSEVENIPNAFKVEKGLEYIGKTIEFATGRYYIQSLSSMIPPMILNPNGTDRVLDLCAAPGSKSTQLAEIMNNEGTLYVNEPNLERVKGLVFNMDKLNIVNFGAIKSKGEILSKHFENYFDKILCDVPCSGLGILQKKGEVSNWWTQNQAEKLAELQLRLLISTVKMLKEGGELVYSTCTLTIEENEFVLNKLLKKYPVELLEIELPLNSHKAATTFDNMELDTSLEKARRIIPWEINSEGFFIAKLRKIGETCQPKRLPVTDKGYSLVGSKSKEIKKYLKQISEYFGIPLEVFDNYRYMKKKKDIYFIHKDWDAVNFNVFTRIGRKFALVDKRDEAHLRTFAVTNLSKHISENIYELSSKEEIETYLSGGTIKGNFSDLGQKVIKINGNLLGTAVIHKEGIKSQFPRSLRTSEIVVPEGI